MRRLITILLIAISEILAVLGALPLSTFGVRYMFDPSFWQRNEMALPAFLAITVGVTLYYTRNEPKIVRISAPIIIVGALILTVQIVQQFS